MSNDQITVRRRRVVPIAPYTMEEAEYTVIVERYEGHGIRETIELVDSIATNILNQRLPLVLGTSESTKTVASIQNQKQVTSSDDPYIVLSWVQSTRKPILFTLRRSKNPSPLERELCEKIKVGNGRHRVGNVIYKLSQDKGIEYIQRWLPEP